MYTDKWDEQERLWNTRGSLNLISGGEELNKPSKSLLRRMRQVIPADWPNDKKTDAKAYANCFGCGDLAHWARATVPAASLKPNAFGLYDMSGNAKQLVQDCYQSNYNGAPTDGSAWDSERCFSRVARGASWQGPEWMARSANREMYSGFDQRTNQVGIRVARTLR